MCISVLFMDDLLYAATVQEFADRLGTAPDDLVWIDGQPSPIEGGYRFCLCPIDVEATATKFGLSATPDVDGDPMCYLLDRTETGERQVNSDCSNPVRVQLGECSND